MVRDGWLYLEVAPDSGLSMSQPPRYTVTLPELHGIEASGVCVLTATGIDGRRLEVESDGLALIRASGRVEQQQITLDGLSRYEAPDLDSAQAEIEALGAAYAIVRVRERLTATVRDAARLEYLGDPEAEVSDGGSLQRVGS